MVSHGERDNPRLFFSSKENDELAQRLLALHTTIRNIPSASQHDNAAFDNAEALFMRDALVIQHELTSARARFDASFRSRRPDLAIPDLCTGEGGDWLAPDSSGNVYGPAYSLLSTACRIRLSVLLMSCSLVLLWKAVELASSAFGAYQVHVAWTLVGIFLGINKRTLSGLLRAVRSYQAAPVPTLKSIYDIEMDFQQQLRDHLTLMRTMHDTHRTPIGLTFGLMFPYLLGAGAFMEIVICTLAGVKLGWRGGPFSIYFNWFLVLSLLKSYTGW